MDAGTSIRNEDVLEKIKHALNDSSYRETIESSSNYNNRLVVERKTRIPFIDSQTGVAQNDCYLWMQKWERMPGIIEGQLYSYPKKRWRKKKRSQYLLNNNYGLKQWGEKIPDKATLELTNGHETTSEPNLLINLKDGSHHHDATLTDKFFDSVISKDDWINELDDVNDFNDTIDNEDNESDYDDDDYTTNKKKKKKKNELTNSTRKKKGVQSSSNATASATDLIDKPYKCDLCGMKYKTRPGLSYHYSHTHSVDVDERKHISLDEDSQQSNTSSLTGGGGVVSVVGNISVGANGLNSRSSQISNSTSNSPLPPSSFNQNSKSNYNNLPSISPVFNKNSDNKSLKQFNPTKKPTTPSSYCDFCLGNSEINKKTRTSEEMISCHHCGRSAHPTCLQFTSNMLKSVKKYAWECLECKSCGICGTSDNDDQLLFCDDCDRGYHSHCVGLKEIPEGEWACQLCIAEYHSDKPASETLSSLNSLNNNSNNSNNTSFNPPITPTTTSTNLNNDNTNLAKLLSTPNTPNTINTANSNSSSNIKSTNSHSNSTIALATRPPSLTTESTAEKS